MADNNRRNLIFDTFDNKETERVPVGFWFHFVFGDDQFRGLEDRSVLDRVIDGHKDFYDAFNPDFVKIMSDGFFGHPSLLEKTIVHADDLYNVKAVGPDHPWITEQVKTVKRIKESFNGDIATFYNIFSPANYIRITFEAWDKDPEKFARFFETDPGALAYAANEIAKDVALLTRKVIEEAGADGIYLSVQNVQTSAATKEAYHTYIAPSELTVLAEANKVSDYNILRCVFAKRCTLPEGTINYIKTNYEMAKPPSLKGQSATVKTLATRSIILKTFSMAARGTT